MQYYNNILAVEAQWLIDNSIMSQACYAKLGQRHDINVVRRGCAGTTALVAFESLPERFKTKVLQIVTDPYQTAKTNAVEECIEASAEIAEFFDTYKVGDKGLQPDKRREYYANAVIFEGIRKLIANRRAKRAALGHTTIRFWDEISECVQALDTKIYPHALPANTRSLERKYKRYTDEGCESLIHKAYKAQNRNAAKVVDNNQQSALAVLMSDPRNLDNEQVSYLYNMLAEQMNWKKIGSGTVAVWREKLDDVIYARRHGATAYRNNKAMQVKRQAPDYPLQFWTMDGWDAELLYQKTNDKNVTVYHNRPTIVVVLDACCKYPIGYAIGDRENPELIKEALRNAAKHTAELFGAMYRTAQLQSDNYAIKKMMPTYTGMAEHATPAAVKNAKAKIIEPWFNYFNKKYCQLQINWSGFGVTSRKELQPNSDYLNKMRHNFPDWDGVCAQLVRFIEAERAQLHDEYMTRFEEMPETRRAALSYEQYLMLFGATTGQRNLLQGSGLKVTIGGVKHDYDCFDPNFRKYASQRWEVRYDPDDKSKVLAVSEDETLRFLCEEKYVQPMALADRKEGDAEQLRRVLDFNKRQELRIANQLGDYMETAVGLLDDTKALDTLQKLMITDSNGQHKDRRNDARLAIKAQEVFEPAEIEEEFYSTY